MVPNTPRDCLKPSVHCPASFQPGSFVPFSFHRHSRLGTLCEAFNLFMFSFQRRSRLGALCEVFSPFMFSFQRRSRLGALCEVFNHVPLCLSMVGAATSIIFVATEVCLPRQNFCRDKIFLLRHNVCRDKHTFAATKDMFYRDKHVFVMTKSKLVATKLCL